MVDDEPLARRNLTLLLSRDPDIASVKLPTLIFVTAYDEYALRAFEAGALDYLLKPFNDARFGRVLDRAKDRLVGWSGCSWLGENITGVRGRRSKGYRTVARGDRRRPRPPAHLRTRNGQY